MHKCRDDLHAPLLLLRPLGTLGRHCSSHCCSGTAWNGWSKRSCLTDAATMMYIVQDEVHGLLMLPTASSGYLPNSLTLRNGLTAKTMRAAGLQLLVGGLASPLQRCLCII